MKTQKILSLILAIALVFSVGCVSAFAEDAQPLVFGAGTDETLKLDGKLEVNGCDGAIWAKDGAKLTINGDDTNLVKGLACPDDGYAMAVYALGEGTEVVINGGRYENEINDETNHVDLIYAKNNASIVINGGTFVCATPQWTLNCKDDSNATIIVKGGTFYKFNPMFAETGDGEIIVPDGYRVDTEDGEWFTVRKEERIIFRGNPEDEIQEIEMELGGIYITEEKSAILAMDNVKLTINPIDEGSGVVAGVHTETGLSTAVWAHNAEVIINGGYYGNTLDTVIDPSHVDLIYASAGGKITINGGRFECATPKWTLNCLDNSGSIITVNGGKFWQFNPAEAQTGEGEIVLGENCKVVKDGDWYEVVADEEANIEFSSKEAITKDGKGAIRFVFKANIPAATNTYFGAYLLPLSVFNASGVANAVQVQYDREIAEESTFSADLVEIPESHFVTSIYAIPYIKTANGVVIFTGATASVNSALAE